MGVILAGGQSRRMGHPKEGVLLPDGRPMLAHILDNLRAVCPRIAVIGPCAGYPVEKDRRIDLHLEDLRPGLGPLSGLETALASGEDELYLVLGCDQPLVQPAILHRLTAAAQAETITLFDAGDAFYPFPGIYPVSLLPYIRDALDNEALSICKLLQSVSVRERVRRVSLAEGMGHCLRGFNTPGELEIFALHPAQRIDY